MATTKIEWADAVWNPITGCSPISEGCDHCYAKRMAHRLKGRYGYPSDDPFRVTFHKSKRFDPSLWRKPRNIFVCSMGDIFHESVEFEWVEEIFEVMRAHNQHTYFLLTKRPNRVVEFWNWRKDVWLGGHMNSVWSKHVWLGVTAENQQRADERIPILLQIPAAVRFVSVEPMLSGIKFNHHWLGACDSEDHPNHSFLDWVICGGETGPGARSAKAEWFNSIIDQCRSAGVPVFIKKAPEGVSIIREFPV